MNIMFLHILTQIHLIFVQVLSRKLTTGGKLQLRTFDQFTEVSLLREALLKPLRILVMHTVFCRRKVAADLPAQRDH